MRVRTFVVPGGLVLAAAAGPASASSDGAWAAFEKRVTRTCIAESGLRDARPSTIVGFDDRVGMVAMLVSDRKRGASLSKLCLYDKRTGKAYVDTAETWAAPPQPR